MPDINDPTNDIDALRGFLSLSARHSFNTIPSDVADRYHRALAALVAERDKLVEDNASQTYKGNSVRYWHDKASAYKATIGSLWEILESAAVRPDGERTITAVLTALIAERDALQQRVEYMKALNSTAVSIISERDALRQRVSELESQEFTLPSDPFRDADRNRRDDLVCSLFPILLAAAWSRQTASTTAAEMAETHAAMRELALVEADAMIAAMRKGEA